MNDLQQQLLANEKERKKLDKELTDIQTSKFWKILSIYKKIQYFLKYFKGTTYQNKNNYFEHIKGNFPENRVLGICHYNWYGVKSGTIQQCSDVLLINNIQNQQHALLINDFIVKHKFDKIAINAIPNGTNILINTLNKVNKGLKIYLIWHGSFTQQTIEDHISRFNEIQEQMPKIYKIGFVKKDMDKIFSRLGYNASFIPNRIAAFSTKPIQHSKKTLNIGVLSSFLWHKNNINQILAASLISNSTIHTLKTPLLFYLDKLLKNKIISHNFLLHDKYVELLGSMDINLYVSLTECYPMVFLESLSLGVPCLVGKTVEPLITNNEIIKYLVVQNPENIFEIEQKIRIVLKKYSYIQKIIHGYIQKTNQENSDNIISFFNEP